MKQSGATDPTVIDEFDGGVGWIAYPDERMERASHALSVDGEIWVFDPVDARGVDDLLADLEGEVAGTVVCLDRHTRDADTIAARHDVPVYVPDWMTDVASEVDAPVERFGRRLGGLRAVTVKDGSIPPWQEVALYDEPGGTLYVAETLGTSSYMVARGERLGVHPMLRLAPPRRPFSGLDPDRVLVGHGRGVLGGGGDAVRAALASSRSKAPSLYLQALRSMLP
ncbi:hypothetical protein K933_06223 [Candidatus Halobonum tyrrellensis G22]|uniref:MBL fold metallo-hydrolase n=2 Tax=Candidatus Halobonum TaxID=1431544 RepID=V4HFY7_9EURY|nr:hypothetical protein K933_06223 [Candidatus Halobonum tyrrellensis G22]